MLIVLFIFALESNGAYVKANIMTVNEFIKELQLISPDKRELPIVIQSPNNMEWPPKVKMKFDNFGSPLLGDKLESMVITWRD